MRIDESQNQSSFIGRDFPKTATEIKMMGTSRFELETPAGE
ncbi:hypothetical protein [Methanoculleus nereidis]|jgi:hypothetical protein|nr:hypothetical protein [Methanoculleus sp. YWC-01]